MRQRFSIALALVFVVGCAFGGSDEDPRKEVVIGDAGDEVDASTDAEATLDGDVDAHQPADTDAALMPPESCEPGAPINTCDPVRNTGCLPVTQCDVDVDSTMAKGRCVFPEMQSGTSCTASFLSTTCPAKSACLAGVCRKLCWCSRDCGAGECCRAAPSLGPSAAFRLCEPC